MIWRRFTAFTMMAFLAAIAFTTPSNTLDDPLNAFPTAEHPAEDRVKSLTEAERQAIRLPVDRDQVVLSIASIAPAKELAEPVKSEPWIRVFANGRIDCGVESPLIVERRNDTLSQAELDWLLHLAVNECRLLSRSTNAIDASFAANGSGGQNAKGAVKGAVPGPFVYRVQLPAGENEVRIPNLALTLRPLRAEMELFAFASLNRYVSFLVARAYLGSVSERQAILEKLNESLKETYPEAPPFLMEHLGAAITTADVDLVAIFQQELELENNRYRRLTGMFRRQTKEMESIVNIDSMEYSKYRDRPRTP